MKAGKILIILGVALTAMYCSNDSKKKGGGDSNPAPTYDPNCAQQQNATQYGGGSGTLNGGTQPYGQTGTASGTSTYGTASGTSSGGYVGSTGTGTGGYGTSGSTNGGGTNGGGSGFNLLQTGTVTWAQIQPTVQQSCATASCHSSTSRAGGIDYSTEQAAIQAVQQGRSGASAIQQRRMPPQNTSFADTQLTFVSQFQQWENSVRNGGTSGIGGITGTNTGNGTYNANPNCQNNQSSF